MAFHVASRFFQAPVNVAHTPENAEGPPMRIVVEGDGTGEAEQEDEPPPAKQRKLEGHRKPVPIELKRKNSCQNL